MAELQFPNILGQFNQGYDRGRSMLSDKLAGQAFSAPADQRQSLLGQLAGVNPQAAMGMQGQFQQQDQAQQAQAKAQQVDHAKKLNGAANFMLQAVATKDPARIQGAWQSVRPYLAELSGKTPPDQFDPAMLPKMYEIVGQTGGIPEQKLTVVSQGSTALGPDGQVAFSNPAAPANGQLVDIPDGQGGTVKMLFDPRTRQLSQPNFGGQPGAGAPAQGGFQTQITPASPANTGAADQANAMLAQGMQPQEVMQRLVQAHPDQQFQLAVDPATGQFKDVSDGSAQFPQRQAMPQPGQLGHAPAKSSGELDKRIALARSMGATDEQVKQMVLGQAATSAASSSGLSDDASEMLSQAAMQGYKIPIPSLGMKSGGDRTKFLNTLAKDVKDSGVDPQTAVRNMVYGESGIFATKAMQKNYGVTMQNEMSAQRQAQIALDASSKLQRGDIQALNQWWLTGKKQFGNVEAQNYANAINTFAEEYAKVMSGSNGSAAATDSSRAKAHEMINTGLSQGQMDGVVALMKQEMRGRTQGQLDAIQSQVRGLRNFGADNGGDEVDQQPTQAVQPAAPQSGGWAIQKVN